MSALAAVKRHWSLLWAARLVAKWEGYVSPATLDTIASPPIWTVGFGHTAGAGAPIPHEGMRVSKATALRILARDCRSSAAAVDRLVKHRLTARQRMALISFTFNLGPNILPGTELLRCLNEGRWTRAAELMKQYDHAGGVVVEGLRRRREAEAWLITHPRAKDRNPHKPRRGDTRAARLAA
jgi:lysozyme